ncbi:MAG: hypothetical protein K1X88_33010 [Nannocystaceae bacterium]|nr:hypothetical protein [Nannocystaceae bacterium]
MAKAVRLPLQIGTSSLWNIARGAILLVPGVLVAPVGIVVGGAIAWYGGGEVSFGIGVFLAVVPILFVLFAIGQLARVLRVRPSDVLLDAEGLRVEGGPHHGAHASWAQLAGDNCRLVSDKDRGLTPSDILAANWSESDRAGQQVVRLVAVQDGRDVVLAEAHAPEERESISALFESIRAGRGEHADEVAPADPEGTTLLRCPSCGTAVRPVAEPRTRCHRCESELPVPPEVAERVRSSDAATGARGRIDAALGKLIEQPGAGWTNVAFTLAGTAMVMAWPASIAIGVVQWQHDNLGAVRVLSLLVFPAAMILGLAFLLRASLVDRFALRLLTLDFGARDPVRPGDPFGCRGCAAPLPAAAQGVLVRCAYCSADNVLGLDLRAHARRSQSVARSLDDALSWRARERRRWRLRLLPALAMTGLGAGLLWLAIRPLPRSHTLTAAAGHGAIERITTDPRDERRPVRSPAGDRLALIVPGEPALVMTVAARDGSDRREGGLGQAATWLADGRLAVLDDGRVLRRAEGDVAPTPAADHAGRYLTGISGNDPFALALADGWIGIASWDELGDDAPRVRGAVLGREAARSPDGRKLAYVRTGSGGDELVVTEVGGAGVRVLSSDPRPKSSPSWSPDGAWIVFAIDEGDAAQPQRNLALVREHDGTVVPLTQGDADACEPSWAADGSVDFVAHAFQRYDVFRVRPQLPPGPAGAAVAEQPLLQPGEAASALVRVTSSQWNEHDPQLSPDGRKLAFFEALSHEGDAGTEHVGMDVAVLTLDGGALWRLPEFSRDSKPLDWARTPTFTPDGASLVFVRADEYTTLQRVPLGKSVVDAERLGGGGNFTNPRVSPDGSLVAVQHRDKAELPWQVTIIAADGTTTALGEGLRPTWLREPGMLAWLRRESGGSQRIWRTRVDAPQQLEPISPATVEIVGLAQHPDGERWIVEVPGEGGSANLWLLARDGTMTAITRGSSDTGRPTVAADGALYFSSNAAGQFDLWRVQLR